MKKVSITTKPTQSPKKPSADAWVGQQSLVQAATEADPIKRLTIDIPLSLHVRVKSQCVLRGISMVDVVREFLEREFAEHSGFGSLSAPAKAAPKIRK